MVDEQSAPIASPTNLKTFSLSVQNFPKSQLVGWRLGSYRVDSTLLIRQKTEWIGPDCFLERHGGEEYAYTLGREKIDFRDGENPYFCFVREGDFLVWREGRWETANKEQQTINLPLMVIKKINEKMMSLEIWHPEGKGKVSLNLIRSKDRDGIPDLSQEFKFIGAKTWAQFIVEGRDGKRMTLRSSDWLLLTAEGWKKLNSTEEIDSYVNRHLVGPLFILDKLTKQNGQQVLEGHLFNTSRTEVEEVTLTANSNLSLANFYRNDHSSPPLLKVKGSE